MKPQELAELLKVDPATIRRWAREDFREFLSPNAQGGNSLHRSFDDRDTRIMYWVAQLRAANTPPAGVVDMLRQSQANGWHDLPSIPGAASASVALMPVDTALTQQAALQKERDLLAAQVAKLETENARLQQRADGLTDQLTDLSRQLLDLNKRLTSMLEKERRRK